MSKTTHVSGNLFGSGSFRGMAKEPAKLSEQLKADFRFKVEDGALYGVDLASAATMQLRQGQKGGETRFDELSGILKMTGRHYRFEDLRVTSGLIAAEGYVKINPKKELDGVVDVELKRSMSIASVPLRISGTVNEPKVSPTKSSMAGTVAGTALMGPGIGTSLGMKTGSAIEKVRGLFGGPEDD